MLPDFSPEISLPAISGTRNFGFKYNRRTQGPSICKPPMQLLSPRGRCASTTGEGGTTTLVARGDARWRSGERVTRRAWWHDHLARREGRGRQAAEGRPAAGAWLTRVAESETQVQRRTSASTHRAVAPAPTFKV